MLISLFNNTPVTPAFIVECLEHKFAYIRKYAIKHNSFKEYHLKPALSSMYDETRIAAASHKLMDESLINIALSDNNVLVRKAAILNSNATLNNIIKAVNDVNPHIRLLAKNKIKK